MKTLTKDQIVAAVDIKTEVVEVPEWGGAVAVRELTGLERDAFEQSMVRVDADGKRQADMSNMRAKLRSLLRPVSQVTLRSRPTWLAVAQTLSWAAALKSTSN